VQVFSQRGTAGEADLAGDVVDGQISRFQEMLRPVDASAAPTQQPA